MTGFDLELLTLLGIGLGVAPLLGALVLASGVFSD